MIEVHNMQGRKLEVLGEIWKPRRISFPRFFHSELSILHYTQNRKLGVETLGVFSKAL